MVEISYSYLAKIVVLLVYLFSSSSTACCPNTESVGEMEHLIVETDNDKTLNISLNELLKIKLPENATSGYRWEIEYYNNEIFNDITSDFYYFNGVIGSGGLVVFTLKPKMIGSSEIAFKLWRHWEGESSISKRFHILVHVRL